MGAAAHHAALLAAGAVCRVAREGGHMLGERGWAALLECVLALDARGLLPPVVGGLPEREESFAGGGQMGAEGGVRAGGGSRDASPKGFPMTPGARGRASCTSCASGGLSKSLSGSGRKLLSTSSRMGDTAGGGVEVVRAGGLPTAGRLRGIPTVGWGVLLPLPLPPRAGSRFRPSTPH